MIQNPPPIQNSLAVTDFQPQGTVIAMISQNFPCQVTTTFAHEYNTGLVVKFILPQAAGMQQLANQIFPITVTDNNTFTIPVDSTLFQPFTFLSALRSQMPAQIMAIAEKTQFLNSAEDNVPPLALQ